jgi:nucleotide-binding universal stress UspA family protein
MYSTSILAVTDLSVDGDYAVERAAQIAMSHTASLNLLYAPMSSTPVCADPADRLAQIAGALSSQPGLKVHTLTATATTLEHIAKQAMEADLVVIPHRRERTLKALLCGPPALRLTRLSHCPVLATQWAPQTHFRRMLVAVDFVSSSEDVAKIGSVLHRDAQVELFHSVNPIGESRLRQADVDPDVIMAYRQSCLQYAQVRMAALTESVGQNDTGMLTAIGRGDPAEQAVRRQELVGADLLVVGKRRSTAFEDFFFGCTARRVLGHAKCDVLIVPHGFQPSTRGTAKMRARTVPAVGSNTLGCTRGKVS